MDGTSPITDVQMCCQAYSAECFACMEGMSVAQYCARHPKPTVCGGPIAGSPHDDSYESYSYGWWPEASPSPAPDPYESTRMAGGHRRRPSPTPPAMGCTTLYESYSSYGWWPRRRRRRSTTTTTRCTR